MKHVPDPSGGEIGVRKGVRFKGEGAKSTVSVRDRECKRKGEKAAGEGKGKSATCKGKGSSQTKKEGKKIFACCHKTYAEESVLGRRGGR